MVQKEQNYFKTCKGNLSLFFVFLGFKYCGEDFVLKIKPLNSDVWFYEVFFNCCWKPISYFM